MYQVISDINLIDRFDLVSEDVVASGFQGSWVTRTSDNKAQLCSGWTTSNGVAYPVWTEENRDGSQGFTPDTAQTTKITVLASPHRAITDRYDHGSAPTLGAWLIPGASKAADSIGSASGTGDDVNGLLEASTSAAEMGKVAKCTKAPYLKTPVHGGTARYVIEIQVL